MLRIVTLGGLHVAMGEHSLRWIHSQRHRAALLVYLAVEGPVSRERVAGVFWPASTPDRARRALNQAVYDLRRRVGDDMVVSDGDMIALAERAWVDVRAFEAACREEKDPEALALYQGRFLEGVHLVDEPDFEHWIERQAAAAERLHRQLRRKRVAALVGTGDIAAALIVAREWVALEPLEDEAQHRLIELLAATGQRTEAMRQYKSYENLLREQELKPLDETQALIAALRAGEAGHIGTPAIGLDVPAAPIEQAVPAAGPAPLAANDDRPSASRPRAARIWARLIAGAAAVALLAAALLLRRDRDGMREAQAGTSTDPAIAVLPFSVSGPDSEQWAEGMVTLLSTGLDGAGGLRAIDSRTVLAQWDRLAHGRPVGPADALEVAFAVGARYALVGTAVVMGPSVRLIADVYGLEGAAPYRQIQVEGEADEILKLVDRLTLAVLQLVLKTDARDLPRVDVGSVTTDSLTALKAFLRGERLFRRSEFRAAVDAYRDAIAGDSSFAMAYFRLWDAIDWRGYPAGSAEGPEDVIERLLEIRDRLPQKQRRLLAARLLRRVSTPRSAQLAYRELAMQYPDAADVWYQLGDLYYHHPATLATLEEAEHAFRMAVEHEPAFAPHRIHVIELAFQNRPDSARIAEEVAAYAALTPPTDGNRRGIEISFALGYGDEQTRTATIAALDTIDLAALIRAMDGPLLHPRFYEAFEIVRERYQQRGGRVSSWMNGEALRKRIFDQGRLREGLSEALGREEPFWPCRLLLAHQMGVPDPDGKLAFTMTLQPGDSAPSRGVWCKGLYAADVQHWADYDRVVAEFRQGRGGVDASDSTATRFLDTALAALEAYAARRRGQPQRALALLEDVYADYTWLERQPNPGADGLPLLFAIAMLHQELGHPDQAVRYLRAFRYNPLADYHLGRVYEQLDSTTEARARYEFFVTHWANADPELQPLVQDARRALGRLKGER